MIPVSGAGGPGFNSRIAPIFDIHSFLIYFYMDNSLNLFNEMEDLEGERREKVQLKEEIITLKTKLADYQKFIKKNNEQVEEISHLKQANRHDQARVEWFCKKVKQLANFIKVRPEHEEYPFKKILLEEEGVTPRWNNSSSNSRIRDRSFYEECIDEEKLINSIFMKFAGMIKFTEELEEKIRSLTKDNEKITEIQMLQHQQNAKTHEMELMMTSKEKQRAELRHQNSEYLTRINDQLRQLEQHKMQNQAWKANLEEKQYENQVLNNQIHQLNENSQESKKKNILEKCQKLINKVQVPQNEYLKNYLMGNGVSIPTKNAKPRRTKMELIFD